MKLEITHGPTKGNIKSSLFKSVRSKEPTFLVALNARIRKKLEIKVGTGGNPIETRLPITILGFEWLADEEAHCIIKGMIGENAPPPIACRPFKAVYNIKYHDGTMEVSLRPITK